MKNYSDITENLDITTKQYVDSGFMPKTGGTFTGDVTITPGHLKTDLIKSADDSKWIAEFTSSGLEIGGSGYALRFYSSTRPVVANQNKELAYTSDIPAAVTESTVSGWGFTKNTGTITGIKMNDSSKGTSGVVDLGTVITDVSGKANLSGGNTFSDLQTINAPTNVSGSEQTTMKVKTSNGGAIIFGKEGANSGTMIRLDQTDGTCRLRFRSSSTAGAMVWEQPEQGANLYIDLGKSGADYHRIAFPSSAGTLALTSQIPTSSTVSNWGFTKNTGTVTSVAVKMNNETKGTVTSSGTIDLGTVITAHQDISGLMPKSGGTFTGNISVPKELVFTNTTNPFIRMTTQGVDFYFQSTSGQFGLGPTWNKATHWDSNGNVTFPTVPKVGNSPLALKSDIPTVDTSNLAKLDTENTFTKGQVITGGTSGGYSIDASGYIKGSWLQASSTTNKGSNTGKVCVFDGNGWIYYRTPSEILSEASGVPKSAFSLSGTTLTITITE